MAEAEPQASRPESDLLEGDGRTTGRKSLLEAVPERERQRLVSGMRWTIWATVATAPLAYCVSALLARMGPDVIAVFGLTGIYSSFASTFLFFGGGTVVVKLAPALPKEKQLAFLVTYLLVIVAFALPWQIAGTLRPSLLRYAFGNSGTQALQILLLWMAPLYVFFLLVDSALASFLELRYLQLLQRFVSVSAFVVYTLSYCLARDFFARHYVSLIWSVYLGFTFTAALIGARKVVGLCGGRLFPPLRSLFLPRGFWRYSIGVQANSLLGVCAALTGVLTLNAGGVAAFGRLTALMAIVTLIDRSVLLILGSFLPSLTSAMELPDPEAASAVVATWSRLVLAGALLACIFVSAFSAPLVSLFGRGYSDLIVLLPIACAGAGIDALNQLTGSINYAVARPYANAVSQLARFLVLLACFWPLWVRYHLLGAVLAWLISEATQCLMQIFLLIVNKNRFRAALYRTVWPYLVVLLGLLILARWGARLAVDERAALYLTCIPLFFFCARYSVTELIGLARLVLPNYPQAPGRSRAI